MIQIVGSNGTLDCMSRDFGIFIPKHFTDVRIKVTNSTSIGCAELLEKGQADLIVCNCPNSRLGSHFQTRVLKEFHDVFVANTDIRVGLMEFLKIINEKIPADRIAGSNTQLAFQQIVS